MKFNVKEFVELSETYGRGVWDKPLYKKLIEIVNVLTSWTVWTWKTPL